MQPPRIRYLLLIAVSSFIVVVTVMTFFSEFDKIRTLSDALDAKTAELEKIERTNQELKRRLDVAKTGEGIEREAREKYNMLKPGEKMYKIKVRNNKKQL